MIQRQQAADGAEDRVALPRWRTAASVPLVALALAACVWVTGTNESLFRAINSWPAATGDAAWSNLTALGEGVTILALSALLIGRRPRLLLAVLLGALLAMALVHPLKDWLDVARPARALGKSSIHVIGESLAKHSFPSGHAATAFGAAALVFGLTRDARARVAGLVLAALVALSRVAVGAHWPIDVLGGAALGWPCACAALHGASAWRRGPSRAARLVLDALPLVAAAYMGVRFAALARGEVVQLGVTLAALIVGVPAWLRLWHRLPAA